MGEGREGGVSTSGRGGAAGLGNNPMASWLGAMAVGSRGGQWMTRRGQGWTVDIGADG